MDPLSIATGAASLAASAFRTSKSIYSCINDIKNADATLLQMQGEVDALHSGLGSIASTFESDDVVQLCTAKSHNHLQSVKLMGSVQPLLADCGSTLGALDTVLRDIRGNPGLKHRLFRQPIKALKINLKSKDIDFIRHQIRSYSSAMQMTLQMIGM